MESNHYDTLDVSSTATQAEIKQAYRRLAKLFHPDSNRDVASHEQITQLNAAYEILGDPRRREFYDRHLFSSSGRGAGFGAWSQRSDRQKRAAEAQSRYQRQRQTGRDADEHLQQWLDQVYKPVNRMIVKILQPLQDELDDLSADPFDDELLENFQIYIEECRDFLKRAQSSFRSVPNPSTVAGVAAHLYYCLNQVGDGIDELERFTFNYDDHHLHTGQELFRIAAGLRREAQAAIKEVA